MLHIQYYIYYLANEVDTLVKGFLQVCLGGCSLSVNSMGQYRDLASCYSTLMPVKYTKARYLTHHNHRSVSYYNYTCYIIVSWNRNLSTWYVFSSVCRVRPNFINTSLSETKFYQHIIIIQFALYLLPNTGITWLLVRRVHYLGCFILLQFINYTLTCWGGMYHYSVNTSELANILCKPQMVIPSLLCQLPCRTLSILPIFHSEISMYMLLFLASLWYQYPYCRWPVFFHHDGGTVNIEGTRFQANI